MKDLFVRYYGIFLLLFLSVACTAQVKEVPDRRLGEHAYSDTFEYVFVRDFSESELGTYESAEAVREWNAESWTHGGGVHKPDDYNMHIVPIDGNHAMKATMDKGESSLTGAISPTDEGGGFRFHPQLPNGHMELYMSYNIMFRPGTDFVLHGKLPSLNGGKWNSYDGLPMTGFNATIAFSGDRFNALEGGIMWYARWAGDQTSGGNGYWKNPDGSPFQFDVSDSTWYNITIRVSQNDLGSNNGIMEGFIDGKLAGQWIDLELRSVNSYIDMISLGWYYGGLGDDFATNYDEWILLDDFYVYYYKNGVDVPRGHTASPKGTVIPLPNERGSISSPVVEDEDIEPPTIPGGLELVNTTESTIDMMWDASFDNVGVSGYRVFLDGVFEISTTNTSILLTGLDQDTEYEVSVSAFDASSVESSPSSPIKARTLSIDTQAPTVPSNLRETNVTGYSAEIAWDQSIDNNSVAHYTVYVDGEPVGNTSELEYYIGDLDPNSNYSFTVAAVDQAGNRSSRSEALGIRTEDSDLEAPTQPTNLEVRDHNESSIAIAWLGSEDNVRVWGYQVIVNEKEWAKTLETNYVLYGLSPGLPYEMTIRAFDEAGNLSLPSNTVNQETDNPDITTIPTFPEVGIVDVRDNTIIRETTTEISALGFTSLEDYGIEIWSDNTGGPIVEEDVVSGLQLSYAVSGGRVKENLQALYTFTEGSGNIVNDISNAGDPLNLEIERQPLTTSWLPKQGLQISRETKLQHPEFPRRLIQALTESNEITIEAWVKQEELSQSGPARIVTLSTDSVTRATSLGHMGNEASFKYLLALNTDGEGGTSMFNVSTSTDFTSANLHHVVFTHSNGGEDNVYVNGQVYYSGNRNGGFTSWNENYRLALANEVTGNRFWKGSFFLVALYNRALSMNEVEQNHNAGYGQIQFTTNLDSLDANTQYSIKPFVSTDQGLVYGTPKPFYYRNVSLTDSLFSFYPNPSSGSMIVTIKNKDKDVKSAFLRIADFTGKVLFNKEIDLSEGLIENIFELQLPSTFQTGMYSFMCIAKSYQAAEKLIILKPAP